MCVQSMLAMRPAALCILALLPCAFSYEHGQVTALPQTCKDRLDHIYSKFYSVEVLEGTMDCKKIIQSNLANVGGVNCTIPEAIRACFNVSAYCACLKQMS